MLRGVAILLPACQLECQGGYKLQVACGPHRSKRQTQTSFAEDRKGSTLPGLSGCLHRIAGRRQEKNWPCPTRVHCVVIKDLELMPHGRTRDLVYTIDDFLSVNSFSNSRDASSHHHTGEFTGTTWDTYYYLLAVTLGVKVWVLQRRA